MSSGFSPYGAIEHAPTGQSTRTPTPVVPHPESLATQAAYTEAGFSVLGPNCLQASGSSSGLPQDSDDDDDVLYIYVL